MNQYLSIGNACNLKCKFCYNDLLREEKTFFIPLKELLSQVIKIREKNNHITIVGGEPLIYPDLEKLLKFINKLNFRSVRIVTNGIKLSDIKIAGLLYKYGVNSLEFSIHANTKELEEEISGRNGDNLIKREKGIKNISILNNKIKNNISLHSNTVINSLNYKEINNIIEYISNLGIKDVTVSFIYNLKGLSDTNKKLLINYSKAIEILNSSKNNFEKINLKIDWLPFCMHKKITNIKYKIREEESCKKFKTDYKNIDSKIKYKEKTKECNNCKVYGKLCNGVFKEYIEIFGDNEFKAVK